MIALTIDLEIDDATIATAGRQVPFVMAKALNASMLIAQQRQKDRMRAIYTIRRKQFLDLSVKLTHFAKKDDLVVELTISPPGNREDIFAKFEHGGRKLPRGHNIAIPVLGGPVKKTRTSLVADQNRPRALLSDASQLTTRTGRTVTRAASFGGAFLRPASGGKPGAIFIRRGKHLLLAYILEPETTIPADLKFDDTVTTAFTRAFPTQFAIAWDKALATARR